MTILYQDFLDCCKHEGLTEDEFLEVHKIDGYLYRRIVRKSFLTSAELEMICKITGTIKQVVMSEYSIVDSKS